MRIGASTDSTRIKFVGDAGFDYLEMALWELAGMNDEDFEACKAEIKKSGLQLEVVNGFSPKGQFVVGPEADPKAYKEYCEKALARAASLGVKISVWGSGKARNIPEGYDRDKAIAEMDAAIRTAADTAEKYGITLVLEHLNFGETNTLNTLASVVECVKRVNHPNVKALVDFYHLALVEESLDSVREAKGLIYHAHLARPEGRKFPAHEDADTIKAWKEVLDEIGYDVRVSVEAGPRVLEDYGKEIKVTREVMEKIFK